MASLSRFLAAGAVAATVGCAHVSTAEPAPRPAPPKLVAVTGSHIPQLVDPRTGAPDTASPVHVYTNQDLMRTGLANTAAALRELEPAMYGP